jgi:hypothetical protein
MVRTYRLRQQEPVGTLTASEDNSLSESDSRLPEPFPDGRNSVEEHNLFIRERAAIPLG